MNARTYRVNLALSPLDFPAIMGLGETSLSYKTESPFIKNGKVVLDITKIYVLLDVGNNKHHEVLSVQSVYEIPMTEIKTRDDVYEFYKDATMNLNEAYQYAKKEMPGLPGIVFPIPPIEQYQPEIDRVFQLLDSRN